MPPEYTRDEDGDLALWAAWAKDHLDCAGWSFDGQTLTCACGAIIPLVAEVSA